MPKLDEFLTGAHPGEKVMFWTAIDPSALDVVGVLSRSRELARLSPFKSVEEALAALADAGCIA